MLGFLQPHWLTITIKIISIFFCTELHYSKNSKSYFEVKGKIKKNTNLYPKHLEHISYENSVATRGKKN